MAETDDVSRSAVSKYGAKVDEVDLFTRKAAYEIRRPETLLTLVVRYADSFGEEAMAFAGGADELVRYDP
jgi:hypothetical protein